MWYPKRSAVIVAVLLASACSSRPPVVFESNLSKFNYLVAKAGSRYALTMAELQKMLTQSKLLPNGGILPVDQIRVYVDSVMTDSLAGLKASQVNLENDKNNYRIYKLRCNDYLVKKYLDEAVYAKAALDSQEVVEMVNSHPELFTVQEQVYLYQILIAPQGLKGGPDSLRVRKLSPAEFDKELKDRAFMIRELAAVPDSFKAVAQRFSDDSDSRRARGLVGWTTRGQYYDPFDSVAFSIKSGEVSRPYHDKDGWHILFVEDYVPAGLVPLDKFFGLARDNAMTLNANARFETVRDSLDHLINLVYNDKILDKNVYYQARDEWVAILNGQDSIRIDDLRTLEEPYRKKYNVDNTTPDMKKEMTRELAGKVMLLQAARAARIDTLPQIIETERQIRHKYCKGVVEQGRFDPTWEPSDELIEYYYKSHEKEFAVGKPLTVQQIIVSDSATGEYVRDQGMAGVDFLELAEKYYPGEPSLRKELANLGGIGPEDVSPEFYHAALVTPVGEVSHPIRTQYGYQVIKVISRRDVLDFPDARLRIIGTLKAEHAEEVSRQYRDKLYAEFGAKLAGKLVPVHLKPLKERSPQP